MKKFLPFFLAAAIFTTCAGRPGKAAFIPTLPVQNPENAEWSGPYIITDHKNSADGGNIPEWVTSYLDRGVRGVEALSSYRNRYVFVSLNEGTHVRALSQWAEGFSAELDFPRLAASRIETRFLASSPYPDSEYGNFFESLIRTASDTQWKGAEKEDEYWIYKKNLSYELTPENEYYVFLILITIDKNSFASQLNEVFRKVMPNPRPTKEQTAAANRVKDRFFDGF